MAELNSFGIKYVVDVRSTPYSKWSPQYNRAELKRLLLSYNIDYVYMGDCIGGRPTDLSCYDEKGRFDYAKMAAIPSFKKGLNRLVTANEKQIPIAVMCSESDPMMCHRSKLIGRELYDKNKIVMKHIIAPKQYITECEVVTELTKGTWTSDGVLFGTQPMPVFKSRKSYR